MRSARPVAAVNSSQGVPSALPTQASKTSPCCVLDCTTFLLVCIEVAAASTCHQLAILTERTGRYREAKGWYLQALKLFAKAAPNGRLQVACLANLAQLLIGEQYPNRMAQLGKARRYAEQARAIAEKLPIEDETWTLYRTLAALADLGAKESEAESYRRREHEVYAAFPAHRDDVNQRYGQFIANVAAAAEGDESARAKVAPELALLEADVNLRPVATAIRRIWAGERDWHDLTKGVNAINALVVLRVIETLQATAVSYPPAGRNVFISKV